MSAEVTVEQVGPRRLAAVVRQVRVGEVGAAWGPASNTVWAFVRSRPGLWTGGHNVFLYRHPTERDAPMEVAFGVEVSGPFEVSGDVVPVETPAGAVATAVHRGPIATIGVTHRAITDWCAAEHRHIGAYSWEVYGDPDPATGAFDVRVEYLLAE
jgi:effector-binding domain-containing protein